MASRQDTREIRQSVLRRIDARIKEEAANGNWKAVINYKNAFYLVARAQLSSGGR